MIKNEDEFIPRKFYVYVHRKATNNEIFYIGKGCKSRYLSKHNRSNFWTKIANKHGVIVEIIIDNLSEELACLLEKEMILFYGRLDLRTGNLINFTEGGQGTSGYIFTQEDKVKISEGLKGSRNGKTDTNQYEFYNLITKEVFVGLRVEFELKFGFKINDLFTKSLTVKNWCLREKLERVKSESATDFGVYIFYKKDGSEFKGTRTAFRKKYNINTKNLFNNQKTKSEKGWYLKSKNPEE